MTIRRRLIGFALAMTCFTVAQAQPAQYKLADGRLTVTTERYVATFEQAALTGLTNRLTDETYAAVRDDVTERLKPMPHGLGMYFRRDVKAFDHYLTQYHNWEGGYERELRLFGPFPFNHHPSGDSAVRMERLDDDRVRVTWTGLTRWAHRIGKQAQDETTFDDESVSLTLGVDPDTGTLHVQGLARSPRKGVYAHGFPMMNFSRDLEVIVPLFQGCSFRPKEMGAFRKSCHWPQPYNASIMLLAGGRGCAALWMEDPLLRDRYVHMHNNEQTFDVSFQSVNHAPFDDSTEAVSRPIRINVYKGNWVTAAKPYRDWWEATFKVKRIDEKLDKLKPIRWVTSFGAYLPPDELAKNVVYYAPQSWKVGPEVGDGGLFPYDMSKGPELNKLGEKTLAHLKKVGSPVMVYLNINHMNEGHPWAKKFWEARIGRHTFGKPPDERDPKFGSASSFLVHTAFRPWQETILDWARMTHARFGISGFYMDCAAGKPNSSTGTIRGMNDAQGQVELIRRIKSTIPGGFTSVEYLTEATGSVTDLAYLGYDGWFGGRDRDGGKHGFRGWRWRERHVHPICGFLYNPYLYITIHSNALATPRFNEVMGRIPKLRFRVYPTGTALEYARTTDFYEMSARLLSTTQMRPVYPETPWGDDVAAVYHDPAGNTYRVLSQTMPEGRMVKTTPQGDTELVYWRIKGRTAAELGSDTVGIDGWIAYHGTRAMGLDPARPYLYGGGSRIRDWEITRLPDGVIVDVARPYKDGLLAVRLRRDDPEVRGAIAFEVATVFKPIALTGPGEVKLEPLGRQGGRNCYRVTAPGPGTVALDEKKPHALVPGDEPARLVGVPTLRTCYVTAEGLRSPMVPRFGPQVSPRRDFIGLMPEGGHHAYADLPVVLPEPREGKKLVLAFDSTVTTHKNNSHHLRVRVNGEVVFEQLRRGGTGTKGHEVDLTRFAGQPVLLSLEVHNHMIFAHARFVSPRLVWQ